MITIDLPQTRKDRRIALRLLQDYAKEHPGEDFWEPTIKDVDPKPGAKKKIPMLIYKDKVVVGLTETTIGMAGGKVGSYGLATLYIKKQYRGQGLSSEVYRICNQMAKAMNFDFFVQIWYPDFVQYKEKFVKLGFVYAIKVGLLEEDGLESTTKFVVGIMFNKQDECPAVRIDSIPNTVSKTGLFSMFNEPQH